MTNQKKNCISCVSNGVGKVSMKKIIVNDKIEFEKIGMSEQDDVMAYNGLTEEVVLLNSTAYEVVKKVKEFGFLQSVINEIEKEYDIDDSNRNEMYVDVKAIIKELIKNNILKYDTERK